jgi:DNA (cytosine-5)-methyltransferase 1
MRLLDLFCKAGGAGMGYHRAGFEVVGVDIKPQPRYPFEFHQADALEYAAAHGHEFDVIHASPPCQAYSCFTPLAHRDNHPDLIAVTRDLLRSIGKPYIIENVTGARHLLDNPLLLCGSMVGLNVWRHRYFEVWPPVLLLTPPCRHDFKPVLITDHGGPNANGIGKPRKRTPIDIKRQAAGIDWMTEAELSEAIPPAYTEFIGRHLRVLAQ